MRKGETMETEIDNQPDTEDYTDFVLWGPKGSGKTFLLKAFHRRIEVINDVLSRGNNFQLSLDRLTETQIIAEKSQATVIGPTSIPVFETYLFTRKGKQNVLSHQTSSYCHRIVLIDNPGGYMPGFNNDELDREQRFIVLANKIVSAAKCIFIILHPGEISPSVLSPTEKYKDGFNYLLSIIKNVQIKRYIVACVPRTDSLGNGIDQEKNVSALMDAWLNEDVGAYIRQQLQILTEEGHNVFYTSCSAVGYYLNEQNELQPNIMSGNTETNSGRIATKRESWKPIRVEEGFFWLFEQLELNRINLSVQRDDGIFYKIFTKVGLFSKKNYDASGRLSEYISYKEMMRFYEYTKEKKL